VAVLIKTNNWDHKHPPPPFISCIHAVDITVKSAERM